MKMKQDNKNVGSRVVMALLAVYFVWGSTYLAIRYGLTGFPPFTMAGLRFLAAGGILYFIMRRGGAPSPTPPEWRGAALVGGFLLLGGNGGVVFAEQWVSSGPAALAIASVPLWTVLFAGFWKKWPSGVEWAGILVGFIGVVVLNLGEDFRANPAGAAALLAAAASWALGSAWSRHVSLPSGLMASAAEMLTGGLLLVLFGAAVGERVYTVPQWQSLAALLYLIAFGSLVGFSSYVYLLKKVRPALATSYAYVNPVIAVMLGTMIAGEKISMQGITAMPLILTGVILVMIGQRRARSVHEKGG